MSRFKELQRSHFKGCTLLHEGVDPNRQRPARYFALPGEFTLIGYSDATDSFLIPAVNNGFLPREAAAGLETIRNGGVHVATNTLVVERKRRVFQEPVEEKPVTTRRRVFHD